MTNPYDPAAGGRPPGPGGGDGSAGYPHQPGAPGGSPYPGQQPQQPGPYTGGPYGGSGQPPPQQWQPGPGQPQQPGPYTGGPYGGPGQPPAQQWQPGPGRQPQWQGQPGYPGPEPQKKNTGKIVGIAVAVVVVLAAAGVGIAAAMGAFAGEDSKPQDTVEALVDAVVSGDGEKVLSLVCQEERESLEALMDDFGETPAEYFEVGDDAPTFSIDVTDVSIDGDSATVTYDGMLDWGDGDVDTESDITESLVKEGGSWKVC